MAKFYEMGVTSRKVSPKIKTIPEFDKSGYLA
jgi:hypothetical protein